jgi:putative nucleotidyltransferase with HDIG domain
MAQTVQVGNLRVGMFVHLDVGWLAHPFPLSSFKIQSAEQIETIRRLGLDSLRWVPEKSDLPPPDVPSDPAAAAPARGAAAETPDQAAVRLRRAQLDAQRRQTRLTERQYAEAARDWRAAQDLVLDQPARARTHTEALTRALLDKMLAEGELCIRVLNGAAGDRATAHAMNVAVVSMLMGRFQGLGAVELQELGVGALMHDVGKLELPERARHVDEASGTDQLQAYRRHVELGVAHARRMGLSAGATQVLAQHHEMIDGSGFPGRLAGDGIAVAARIVALVNRFDNLCNPAVLARARTPHEALSLMFAQARSQFDAALLNGFIRMMGVYPAGSVVQLTDDRYALVVSVNPQRPLKPRVLVHDARVPLDEALVLDLETVPELGIRRSLRAAQLPTATLQYLAPRPRVAYYFEAGGAQPGEVAAESLS